MIKFDFRICLKLGRVPEQFKRKEKKNMIDVYLALIINGKRTLSQVPARYQAEVRALLEALGLDGDGNVAA